MSRLQMDSNYVGNGMEVDQEVSLKINKFKADLPIMTTTSLFHKYVTFEDCYIFSRERYIELREEVAKHFNIHPSDVLVVGSAKMGFSITRGKRYRPFGDTSDIDVAIISSELFDEIWKQVFDYWAEGGSLDDTAWPQRDRNAFNKYLFRGWIRPDKLPSSRIFELGRDWWQFFEQLPSSGLYGPSKIAGGLYKSWHFLEKYQSVCINECKQDLEIEQNKSEEKVEE